jgi:hypothetical protein
MGVNMTAEHKSSKGDEAQLGDGDEDDNITQQKTAIETNTIADPKSSKHDKAPLET